ncbi:MAG: hypothetical protein AB1599_04435 [Planctomycetota bacterium]
MKRIGLILFLLSATCPLYAQDTSAYMPLNIDEKVTNSVDFRIGAEVLRYEEAEPDTKTIGEAETMNMVGILDISQEYQQFLGGIRGVIPLTLGDDREEWDVNGVINYQTDKLDYYWSRIDGYIGYTFKESDDFTMPGTWYAGLRRSEGVQQRSDVVASGPQLSVGNRKIQSYGLFVGYKGETVLAHERRPEWSEEFTPVLKATWMVEYHKPILNHVTNTSLLGALFKDRIGYTAEFGGGASYIMSRSFSASFNFYGGRMYWEGSAWENFGAGFVKWPENKTDYLGANFGLLILF